MSTITFGYTDGFTRDAERHLRLVRMQPTDEPRLRLTRRGRVVIAALALVAVALLAIVFGPSGAATGESGASAPYATITVQPGQTIWEIAAAANPNGDIRDTVDQIIRLNALESASGLQMGAQLAVPTYR